MPDTVSLEVLNSKAINPSSAEIVEPNRNKG
jgi:hypothetical protein